MNILTMLSKVAPILLLIIMGSVFQRTQFLQQQTISEMKKLVINITLPMLLFLSFSNMNLTGRDLIVVVTIFSACVLMLFVGIFLRKLFKQENPYFAALFAGFEAGMLAYPLFIPVFGVENTATVAIVHVGQTVFCFFVLFSYMLHQGGRSLPAGQQLVVFIKMPIIQAVLLGILTGVTGFGRILAESIIGGTILEWMRLISTLTVPIIVLVIGYELRLDLHDLKKLRGPILTSLLRLSLMVLMAFAINTLVIDRILHLGWIFQAAVYTIFLLPPPFMIPFFMQGAKEEDRQFVLSTISVHIVLSLAAYIVFILVI